MEERYEFDEPAQLAAVSVGVPGKRTFFLILGQRGEWVRAWLEKELLEALALAVEQFLGSLARENLYSPPQAEPEPGPVEAPAGLPAVELEIDQITLGYDRGRVVLECLVHELGPQTEGQAELYCRFAPARLKTLGIQAAEICAAGRPRCKLCGGPIGPEGHICPMSN